MLRKDIKVKKIDGIYWPMKCPYCGQSMKERGIVSYDIKITKTLRVLFVSGMGPKRLNVKLCGVCAIRISRFKTMETVGSIILFAAILLVTFFNKMNNTYKIFIGGAAFWLGVILMGIGEMASKKLVGVECRLIGENKWELKFKNDIFFNEFASLNSKYVDRI